jgi:DNA-binding IclR family transcriptional regulator
VEGDAIVTASVETVAGLMGIDAISLRRAQHVLTLLGDSGRRTIIEQLALTPQAPAGGLPGTTGMSHPDLYHRLRSLRRNGVLHRSRHHVYSVDPDTLRCMSRYMDSLMVAASLTHVARPEAGDDG